VGVRRGGNQRIAAGGGGTAIIWIDWSHRTELQGQINSYTSPLSECTHTHKGCHVCVCVWKCSSKCGRKTLETRNPPTDPSKVSGSEPHPTPRIIGNLAGSIGNLVAAPKRG